MNILGISCFYHDAAAALLTDGHIVAAAQEERFTRKKHDENFPVHAVRYCLEEGGLTPADIDQVVFYDKPLLKFERLLETYYAFSPKGWRSFMQSMPVWIKEKVFLKKMIRTGLAEAHADFSPEIRLLFPEHHLSHAASAFYPSPYEAAAILTIDGVGEWCTTSIGKGAGNQISILKELHFPHSVGLLYSAFTYFLGFKVNSGEYKLMGLAPYGNASSENVARFKDIIRTRLCTIYEDGSIFLDQAYFQYSTGLRMIYDDKWEALFGFSRKEDEEPLQQHHCDLALAIQQVTEEIVLKLTHTAKESTGCDYLCLAGGVALNCVANGKLKDAGIFKDIYIQPAAGDAGGALGAALAAHYIHQGNARTTGNDAMMGAYLGPSFTDSDIEKTVRRKKAVAHHTPEEPVLIQAIAREIAQGKIIGWFQGRMEFGPRALGNRSIIADPRNPEMQKKLNLKIKFREGFRPFAPILLQSEADRLFGEQTPSPYMLLVHSLLPAYRNPLPENYDQMPLTDKLYFQRSSLPAITHIDFSARLQTVSEAYNARLYHLLQEFRKESGFGVLINTSFNVRGEPIVCTPDDAYTCFMHTDMDILVMGDYILYKSEQPQLTRQEQQARVFDKD